MKKIMRFISFIIWGNILIVAAVFLVYTMVGFLYFYSHLKQDPMGYFSWWWAHIVSFRIMDYKYYIAAFEILLVISGIVYVSKQSKDEKK